MTKSISGILYPALDDNPVLQAQIDRIWAETEATPAPAPPAVEPNPAHAQSSTELAALAEIRRELADIRSQLAELRAQNLEQLPDDLSRELGATIIRNGLALYRESPEYRQRQQDEQGEVDSFFRDRPMPRIV